MRKLCNRILVALLIVCLLVGTAFAADVNMKIHYKDGSIVADTDAAEIVMGSGETVAEFTVTLTADRDFVGAQITLQPSDPEAMELDVEYDLDDFTFPVTLYDSDMSTGEDGTGSADFDYLTIGFDATSGKNEFKKGSEIEATVKCYYNGEKSQTIKLLDVDFDWVDDEGGSHSTTAKDLFEVKLSRAGSENKTGNSSGKPNSGNGATTSCDGGATCPSAHFTDIAVSDWFHEAVDYAVVNGLFNGTSGTTFSPNAAMTRAMLVTVLYRLEGEPVVSGSCGFEDVVADSYYEDAVIWANGHEIVLGFSDTEFRPDVNITREQMAAILYRYASYKGYDVSASASLDGFSDAGSVSTYAIEPMQWAVGEELITGVTTTTLVPKGSATRAQVATILMRFCENVAK